MQFVTSFHFLLAFLVALCALVFSWNVTGRRVVNAVLGVQVLVGLALAGMYGANHMTLPHAFPAHIGAVLGALICYGIAGAVGRRAGGTRSAIVFSIFGVVLVAIAIGYGVQMYLHG